jgi:mono/diheme cytochrome c family protein
MQRGLPVLAALILAGSAAIFAQSESQSQESQKPAAQAAKPAGSAYVIPPEEAKKPNPIKATPASLAEGKMMYGYDCVPCHGASGNGKGELAAELKLNLKDFRDATSLKDLSDGEMYYIIYKGKGQMPKEEGRQKPDGIWNMINFVRSLAKKSPPPEAN